MLASLLLVSCGNHEEHGQTEHSAPMGHGHGATYEAPTGPLVPDKGDHVVIVGNTFAERMGHFGHFETLLHDAYPDHELVVRNLGWSGDTPSLQPRPLDFGTMEEYLVQEQADIIIACFGMNESFAGEAGRVIRSQKPVFAKQLGKAKRTKRKTGVPHEPPAVQKRSPDR